MALVVSGLWGRREHDQAITEGWYIDATEFTSWTGTRREQTKEIRIRSADTSRWRADDDCAAHVKRMAVLGSRFHATALAAVAKIDAEEFVRIMTGLR